MTRGLYRRGGKRCLDLVLAVPAALVLLPACLIVALLVRISLGSPVLFRQKRSGLNSKTFEMIKFRSMREARDSSGALPPDRDRLTSFGKLLRRTSLDELPSLLSVIEGRMSLVGPRPLLVRYLERYTERQGRRHEVRPGITGWAQVNGRNAVDWHEKLEMDVWYVDNLTLCLDLRILFRTLVVAVTGRGVSAQGEATMPEFTGREDRP